jgi:serine/threonine-protein kinase HipA
MKWVLFLKMKICPKGYVIKRLIMSEIVEIYLYPDIFIGNLYFRFNNGKQSSSFEYDRDWIKDEKNSFAIEPSLELYPVQYHVKNIPIFGSLSDCSPDRWGRNLIIRKETKRAEKLNQAPKSVSELDFLLGVNDETRQGALRFKIKGNNKYLSVNEKDSIPPLISLPRLLNATEKMLESRESEEDLRLLLNGGPSLGGARPKTSIYSGNNLSIAKFPKNDDEINVSLWEALALTLAKKAGINVPDWSVEKVVGKTVLVLNRFDRIGKNRIPFISAMTMLEAKDQEQHSYIEIANAIINNGSNPEKDLKELWRRMVFNISISNIDDHLRNHGFLLNEKKCWELSPAYDMNPVSRQLRPNFHVLSIDDISTEGLIDTAFSVIDEFRLDKKNANSIYNDVNNSVSEWRNTARSLGISKQEINMMESAFPP